MITALSLMVRKLAFMDTRLINPVFASRCHKKISLLRDFFMANIITSLATPFLQTSHQLIADLSMLLLFQQHLGLNEARSYT